MPDDKHYHITPGHPGDYPEPDIPADEAWAQMKHLLPPSPVAGPAGKLLTVLQKKAFLYGIPGLALVAAITWYLSIHIPATPRRSNSIVYTTRSKPQQETLANNLVLYIDHYSTISATPSAGKDLVISVRGGVYVEAAQGNPPTARITAGSVEILPVQANLYVAFDTASSVSLVEVQSGRAVVKAGNAIITIVAGQAARYNEKTKHLEPKQKANVNAFGYATRNFEFINTPLKEIVAHLEKAYGVSFRFADTSLYDSRITASFDNKPLREVLDILAYTLNFDYTLDQKKNQVVLKGNGHP